MALGLAREQAERLGLQAVAGENCHALAVNHVRRWPPAAQVIVIHRREVVVDQRVGVNHLERAGRRHGGVARGGCRSAHGLRDALGAGQYQQRPQPLAAGHQAVAHGVSHLGGHFGRCREKPREGSLDFLSPHVYVLRERHDSSSSSGRRRDAGACLSSPRSLTISMRFSASSSRE